MTKLTKVQSFKGTNESHATAEDFRADWSGVSVETFDGAAYLGEVDGLHRFAAAIFSDDGEPSHAFEVAFSAPEGVIPSELAALAVGVVRHRLHGLDSGSFSDEFRAAVADAMSDNDQDDADQEEGAGLDLPEGYKFETEPHFTGENIGVLSFEGKTVKLFRGWEPEEIADAAESHAKRRAMAEGPADCVAILFRESGLLAHIARGTTNAEAACEQFGRMVATEIDPDGLHCMAVTSAQADALEAWAAAGSHADAFPLDD